ncbi:MAG: hypothetical protein ACYTER_02855 [Planctomycetota bacterium]
MGNISGGGSVLEQMSPEVLYAVRGMAPWTAGRLWQYLRVFLGMRVPNRRICSGHVSPMEYLWYAFSVDQEHRNPRTQGLRNNGGGFAAADLNRSLGYARDDSYNARDDSYNARDDGYENSRIQEYKNTGTQEPRNGDCVVWANRGGGKTQLAAVATLLEGLFKPGCQTRILAGSLDQSRRMYEYVCAFVEQSFKDRLAGRMLKESCGFANGATVQILPQSVAAIRGRHIHKLRCDEIEMFDADVFKAAQFVTQSTGGLVAGMEMFSTMHRPYGLMQRVIDQAVETGIPVFQWCLWEVIERCTEDRSCSRCVLNSDCRGKARRANGYLKIDDCISQMRRSSRAGFEAEMLCLRPNLENAVFAEFDPNVHVAPMGYDASLPLYRAIDFGFVNPFVCLWIQVDGDGVVRVIDEYVKSRVAIAGHTSVLKARTPCDESQVDGTFCDPAGAGRNDVTGTSAVAEMAARGIRARYCKSGITEGIEKIRAALRSGDRQSRLVIDSRCRRLD